MTRWGRPEGRNRLSQAASAVLRIRDGHARAAEYDAGFDAGEWSGPAHARMAAAQVVAALAALGYTPAQYDAELAARTSPRWAHYSGLEARQ